MIFAAAESKKIKGVIAESVYPRFENHARIKISDKYLLPGTQEQKAYLADFKKKLNIDEDIAPINYVGKISPRPILIIHGDKDTDVPVEAADKLYEEAGFPKDIWTAKNGDHFSCYTVNPRLYNQRVLDFIRQYF